MMRAPAFCSVCSRAAHDLEARLLDVEAQLRAAAGPPQAAPAARVEQDETAMLKATVLRQEARIRELEAQLAEAQADVANVEASTSEAEVRVSEAVAQAVATEQLAIESQLQLEGAQQSCHDLGRALGVERERSAHKDSLRRMEQLEQSTRGRVVQLEKMQSDLFLLRIDPREVRRTRKLREKIEKTIALQGAEVADLARLRQKLELQEAFVSAIEAGNAGLVAQLLDRGASVNLVDANGDAPLHYAAARGYTGVVRLLVERGADMAQSAEGGVPPLVFAAHANQVAVLELMHALGADLDLTDRLGRTALHTAAQKGHVQCVKSLLAHGTFIHARDGQGNTALHFAVVSGESEAATLLLQNGARHDEPNRAGHTAKQLALRVVRNGGNMKSGIVALLKIFQESERHRMQGPGGPSASRATQDVQPPATPSSAFEGTSKDALDELLGD